MTQERDKLKKDQNESKKKIEEQASKIDKQHEEISKLQRENGLLEELNRSLNDLNKALEFPKLTGEPESSSKNASRPRGKDAIKGTYTNLCKNGFTCEYEKKGKCKFEHRRCRNGPTCQFLRSTYGCRFLHDETAEKRAKNPNKTCRNGAKCEYYKKGRCNFKHEKELPDEGTPKHNEVNGKKMQKWTYM